MQYLKMRNLHPGMILARKIIGENGNLLVNAGNSLSETVLKRMTSMGFQGAYIENPIVSDIIVEDIVSDEMRTIAFEALSKGDVSGAVRIAKKMVQEIKYKETLKLDLLDIKNDKNYVFKHSVSVAVFSIVIGLGCELSMDQLDSLAIAGILHDIGKLDIKKKVLNAKHIYSEKEMDEMKKHPVKGYEISQDYAEVSSVSRNAILFHHENLDGSGYYGITEEKLGILPRILRVADTYDALTAQKKYRDASAPAQAVEYLMSNVDKIFDKNVVEVFVKRFPVYPEGFTVRLSNSELGIIVDNSKNALRPVVRKMDGSDIDLAADPNYRSVIIQDFL